ncbi:MAG: hypothetical protein ACO3DS_09210, partial [Phycisphaerales bacterium]
MADSILLIDDDAAILRALGSFLEAEGWDTYRELTSQAGIETAERVQPEVVSAVEAMRRGAESFLVEPMDPPLLKATVERAAEKV